MEFRKICKFGNSTGITLDKGTLANVYNVKIGDSLQIDYDFPYIIISVPGLETWKHKNKLIKNKEEEKEKKSEECQSY